MNAPLRSLSLLLPLLVGLYAPFLGGGFLTDDFIHLDRLADVDSITTLLTTPDGFGFYRPVTQASLKLDTVVFGRHAAGFRAVNLALHAGVIGAAFLVARLVLPRPLAAVLATIAFALTPKAHPIAVLWISGRAELLLALFSLIAVAAWIVWSRNGRARWLVVAAAAYIVALGSKETALLLPLLYLATPSATRPWRSRLGAVTMLLGFAAVIFVWRSSIGALTPFSSDEHYSMATGVARWVRSARNYAPRIAPAPVALLVLVGAAGFLAAGRRALRVDAMREQVPVGVFSLAWLAVFLAPVARRGRGDRLKRTRLPSSLCLETPRPNAFSKPRSTGRFRPCCISCSEASRRGRSSTPACRQLQTRFASSASTGGARSRCAALIPDRRNARLPDAQPSGCSFCRTVPRWGELRCLCYHIRQLTYD
jgi:hypothetical protein